MANTTRKLPIFSMTLAVYGFLLGHLRTFGRLAVRPIVVLFGYSFIAGTYFPDAVLSTVGSIVDAAVSFLLLTPFLVAWHRLVLLGPESIAGHRGLAFERRDRIFFLWSVLLAVLIELFLRFLAVLPTDFIHEACDFTELGMAGGVIATVLIQAVLFPFIVLLSRLSLVFPSVAIDAGASPGVAWRSTEGNALRLAVLAYLVCAPFSIVFTVVDLAVEHLDTWLATQGYDVDWRVALFTVVHIIWKFSITALLATGLSLTYRLLTAPKEDGEDGRESTS